LNTVAFFEHRSFSEGVSEGGSFAGANINSKCQNSNTVFCFDNFCYIAK